MKTNLTEQITRTLNLKQTREGMHEPRAIECLLSGKKHVLGYAENSACLESDIVDILSKHRIFEPLCNTNEGYCIGG